jgi:hypothetical protein
VTNDDLASIEERLGLKLPEAYRQFVTPYPIPALAGNTETELWDDAERLISLNLELRAGSKTRAAWPEHLFCVGELDGESFVAIDVRDANAPVWWVDHGHLGNSGSGRTHDRFPDWATEYIAGYREDLVGDGYDPEGTPDRLKTRQEQEARSASRGCIIALVILVFGLFLWLWLR